MNKHIKEKKFMKLHIKKTWSKQDRLNMKKWDRLFPTCIVFKELTHDVVARVYKRYLKEYKENKMILPKYPYGSVDKNMFQLAIKNVIFYFIDGKEDYSFSPYSWGEFYFKVSRMSGLYEFIQNNIKR